MITLDHDIEVFHYRPNQGSPLVQIVNDCDNKCRAFIEGVKRFLKTHGGLSAALKHDFSGFSICGIEFEEAKVPLGWKADIFYGFTPANDKAAIEDFIRLGLEYFSKSHKILGLRYGYLNNQLVFAIRANPDGSAPKYDDLGLTQLSDDDLKGMKSHATHEELAHITSLGRYYWTPPVLRQADVFKRAHPENFSIDAGRPNMFKIRLGQLFNAVGGIVMPSNARERSPNGP